MQELTEPDLSIVIPLYNDKNKIRTCLDSIKNHMGKLNLEVIVVDNASTDGGPEMIEKEFGWVKLIRNKENLFFNRANNQGFNAATGVYCMTLNQDTEIRDDALEIMVEYLRAHPGIGLVSCPLYYPDGTPQNNCWKFRNVTRILLMSQVFKSFRFLFPKYYDRIYRSLRYLDTPGDEKEVDTIMGACMMGPTKLIQKVGGFDEDILMGYTDDVLCIKIRREGYGVIYLSRGYIIHHEEKGAKKSAKLAKITDSDVIVYARRYIGWYAPFILYPFKILDRLIKGY